MIHKRLLILPLAILVVFGCTNSKSSKATPSFTSTGITSTLPNFDYSPKSATETCDKILAKAKAEFDKLATIPKETLTFDNTVGEMDRIIGEANETLNPLEFLENVSTNKELRDAAQSCKKKDANLSVDLLARKDLYQIFSTYATKKEKLPPHKQKYLDDIIRRFRLNGLSLSKEKKALLIGIKKEIVVLGLEFDKNIAEYKNPLLVTKSDLEGMTDGFINSLEKIDEKYKVTLAYPHFFPIVKYANNANIRKELYTRFLNRAAIKNVPILEKILRLRMKQARLLGYNNYASLSLENKMAKNTQTVENFYDDLGSKIKEEAANDYEDMLRLKRKHDDPNAKKVHMWDKFYYTELAKKERFKVDNQKIKEYFPFDQVKSGLFDIYQNLFSVQFNEVKDAKTWHRDVELFAVKDNNTHEILGHFYLDLYPRDGKFSHAAVSPVVVGRVMKDQTYRAPIAIMMANFSKPTKDAPALFTHGEVSTFFHEFGHLMHAILSRGEYQELSGMNVAHDFIEAPSQMLENWVWSKEGLNKLSGHYKDRSKKLPPDLVQNMIKAKNLYTGTFHANQIFYGMLNHYYHTHENIDSTAIVKELQENYTLFDYIEGTHFQGSFGHLIGYAAVYYGYLWSEVFAADMFTRFEKEGVLNPKVGMEYRKKVLEPGATRDEYEMVSDFLGRKPNQKAFLKSIGLN